MLNARNVQHHADVHELALVSSGHEGSISGMSHRLTAHHRHLHRPHMLNSREQDEPGNATESGTRLGQKHKHHAGDSWRLLSLHGDHDDHPPQDHIQGRAAPKESAPREAAEDATPGLEDRKREFRRKMGACTQLKIFSERTRCLHRVKMATHRAEREIRAKSPSTTTDRPPKGVAADRPHVTDEMGRSMPVLFGGKPQPVEHSGASLAKAGGALSLLALSLAHVC